MEDWGQRMRGRGWGRRRDRRRKRKVQCTPRCPTWVAEMSTRRKVTSSDWDMLRGPWASAWRYQGWVEAVGQGRCQMRVTVTETLGGVGAPASAQGEAQRADVARTHPGTHRR